MRPLTASTAWAENGAGGVHGRKLRLALADDGYDAERVFRADVLAYGLRRVTKVPQFASWLRGASGMNSVAIHRLPLSSGTTAE